MFCKKSFFSINKLSNFFYSKTRYNFWGFNKQEIKKEDQRKIQFENLNKNYQEFLKEARYNIRKPYKEDYFISRELKENQLKQSKKQFKEFLDSYKFHNEIQEEKFINLLSNLSYTVDNREIIKSQEFYNLIEEYASKVHFFINFDYFAQFVVFCSSQDFNVPESAWESFSSHILNNYPLISFDKQIHIIQCINSKNWHVFQELFHLFENEILQQIQKESQQIKYQYIIDALNIYTKYKQGSKEFFYTLHQIIFENVEFISIENLIQNLYYFCNSKNQQFDLNFKVQILEKMEQRLLKLSKFFNSSEILSILYNFIKSGKGSDFFFLILEKRISLIIDQMQIEDIKKLMLIIANRPKSITSVYKIIETHIITNLQLIHKKHFSEIFFLFCENNQGSDSFFNLIEQKLLDNIFNYNVDDLCNCCWAYALKQIFHYSLFFHKVEESIKEKYKDLTVRQISILVWSFSKTQSGTPEFYQSIENQIRQRENLTAKDCCRLLWAYVLNIELRSDIVEKFKEIILKNKNDLDCWDISTLLWSFTQFKSFDSKQIFQQLEEIVVSKLEEMNNQEITQTLRAYVESKSETQQIIDKCADLILENLQELNHDQVIVCLYSLSLMTQVEVNEKIGRLIEKLIEREEQFNKLTVINNEQSNQKQNANFDINDVDYYIKNQQLNQLK